MPKPPDHLVTDEERYEWLKRFPPGPKLGDTPWAAHALKLRGHISALAKKTVGMPNGRMKPQSRDREILLLAHYHYLNKLPPKQKLGDIPWAARALEQKDEM